MSKPQKFWLEGEIQFSNQTDPDGAFDALADELDDSTFRAVYDATNAKYLLLSEVVE
ncbi:hypothetical protein [Halostagnicola sp. A56]|uniref:hypothetical protein n=1 Tax=Halostagnicola sp. A56 TaxID=1495067 RepID=UPI0012E1794F|nr:hypothetical protein [Halostagnicola sp. A56]